MAQPRDVIPDRGYERTPVYGSWDDGNLNRIWGYEPNHREHDKEVYGDPQYWGKQVSASEWDITNIDQPNWSARILTDLK